MKYKGAISDTDILINLAKADCLNVLECLFDEIIVPQYIVKVELKNKAGRYYYKILQFINDDKSIFKIVDRKNDKIINNLAKPTIECKKQLIGPGESECAGYAIAMRIPIIISDNYTEFKWLEEFIALTHRNILTLCVYFDYLTMESATVIFEDINSQLSKPSTNTIDDFYKRSWLWGYDKLERNAAV